jgi:hypothetical protein
MYFLSIDKELREMCFLVVLDFFRDPDVRIERDGWLHVGGSGRDVGSVFEVCMVKKDELMFCSIVLSSLVCVLSVDTNTQAV